MEKNATINARLKDLLEVMDARATVNIFVGDMDKQTSIKYLRVYEFLAEPELMRKYKNYEVVGLNIGLQTNILIKEV